MRTQITHTVIHLITTFLAGKDNTICTIGLSHNMSPSWKCPLFQRGSGQAHWNFSLPWKSSEMNPMTLWMPIFLGKVGTCTGCITNVSIPCTLAAVWPNIITQLVHVSGWLQGKCLFAEETESRTKEH